MAKITRRMAINNVQQILSKYRTKIIEGKNYIDYLPLQGKEIVNKYNNNTNDYKSLLDAAVHSKDFFIGIDDETLILYTNICDKINKVFDLNISESKKITGFIDERFVVRSAEEVITGIRTVEIGRKVEYKLGTADKLQEDLKVFNRYYVEWEVEDIDNNFSDVHNTFESVAENIVDYLDNNFANRYDRTFEAVKEGRYIIKAKVHDLVIGNVIDTIEFEQIVETGDKTIMSMDLQQKILRALQLTNWKVDLDFAALSQALFVAAGVIVAIAAIATVAPELAAAIVAIMTIGMGIDAAINIIKGIVQLSEALQLIDKARSERALQVGGEKIKEGILNIGVGIIEVLLKKLTMKNLANARVQVLKNVTPKTAALPQTALSGSADTLGVAAKSTATVPAVTASTNEVTVVLNKSAVQAMENVAQMSVLQSEKVALQEMISTEKLPGIDSVVQAGSDSKTIDISIYYKECNRIVNEAYKKSTAPVETNETGEFQKLLNYLEKDLLSKDLQKQINDIPKGQRGDYRVPMPEKIKGIRIDKDSGQARIIEAWKPDTDGAKFGTREMCIIKKGTILDRIGAPSGNYLSPMKPDGTPYSLKERAIGDYLPEEKIEDNDSYHKYVATMDFTRENFEEAINKSKLSSIDKEKLRIKLEMYYDDSEKVVNTIDHRHEGEAYNKDKKTDGVQSGEIDEMFIHEEGNTDGGAIQYITPFSVMELTETLHMIDEVK